ncbi:MAG: FMN-binding protein [Mycobacteriales bacterium]
MLKVALALAATATGLVLLLSYKTPDQAARSAPPPAVAPPQQSQSPAPGSTGGPTGGPTAGTGSRTVTGSSVDTPYGPVQVRITLANGRLTDVTAVQYPNDRRRSVEINDEALPVLRSEALKAQSARIDEVSGATWTSDAYLRSLQSALDKARGG